MPHVKLVLFVSLLVLPIVVGLVCHHCDDGTRESNCRTNTKRLEKSPKTGVTGPNDWVKNCSLAHSNYTMCMIEEVASQGEVHYFKRDCSDGNTFSFPKDGELVFLRPNNQTICRYRGEGHKICITLCNQTDFCNGPSSSNVVKASSFLVLSALFFHTVCRI